jgi:hypothetical protein
MPWYHLKRLGHHRIIPDAFLFIIRHSSDAVSTLLLKERRKIKCKKIEHFILRYEKRYLKSIIIYLWYQYARQGDQLLRQELSVESKRRATYDWPSINILYINLARIYVDVMCVCVHKIIF